MCDDCGIMFRGEWHVVWGAYILEPQRGFLDHHCRELEEPSRRSFTMPGWW